MRPSNGLGSARASRVGFGALAQTGFFQRRRRVFDREKSPRWRGAIGPSRTGGYTRGRVRSPNMRKNE